jgi:hypothetical protein
MRKERAKNEEIFKFEALLSICEMENLNFAVFKVEILIFQNKQNFKGFVKKNR